MTLLRSDTPLVHHPWTHRWWDGSAALAEIFGPPPSLASLSHVRDELLSRKTPKNWQAHLSGGGALPKNTLFVLAGQQPVLAGGPALVAHKAATAVALARLLQKEWNHPVLPLFLLATEDHDTDEIDHVDVLNERGSPHRVRCDITPKHETFHRCTWKSEALFSALNTVAGLKTATHPLLFSAAEAPGFAGHVETLLQAVFPDLNVTQAHQFLGAGEQLLISALTNPETLLSHLALAEQKLSAVNLPALLDARDPRPPVMESRDGRRRRVASDDRAALERIKSSLQDFSPHASLRPLVQAAALPVVAQVCGPSEILYLGQMRGLHQANNLPAPILVPRLEATAMQDHKDVSMNTLSLLTSEKNLAAGPSRDIDALYQAAQSLADRVIRKDPSLKQRAERWLTSITQGATRLAEAPSFRGYRSQQEKLLPRGRPQDTTLAWLPHALAWDDPVVWGEHLVGLCDPLAPPVHTLHALTDKDLSPVTPHE